MDEEEVDEMIDKRIERLVKIAFYEPTMPKWAVDAAVADLVALSGLKK